MLRPREYAGVPGYLQARPPLGNIPVLNSPFHHDTILPVLHFDDSYCLPDCRSVDGDARLADYRQRKAGSSYEGSNKMRKDP